MQESRQLRRAQLAEAIKRQRHLLYAMKLAEDKVPQSMKDRHTGSIQEITAKLHEMEVEFHELNVQQIREELKGG
jgi:hypothetical protein